MANKEIVGWFTVNGNHIPIMKGEGKTKALKKFIDKKRNMVVHNRKNERNDKFYEEGRKGRKEAINEFKKSTSAEEDDEIMERIDREAGAVADKYMRDKYGKNWNNPTKDTTIKGRAKTSEEVEDERFDKYVGTTHEVYEKMKYDNSNKRKSKSREDMLADAREVAHASSMYDMDYKYGKGGTNENKQVKIGDKIESAKYKLKEDKSITTPSGKFTPSQIESRDTMIKKLYKEAWDGKKSYTVLNNALESLVKDGKISRGELSSLQYEASREHDQASTKQTIKGYKTFPATNKNTQYDGKTHLQFVGDVDAKKVGNLRKGDVLMWNAGVTSVVQDIKPTKSGKSVTVTTKSSETGNIYTRTMRADRLVGIAEREAKNYNEQWSLSVSKGKTLQKSNNIYKDKTATNTNSGTHYKRINAIQGVTKQTMGTTYAVYDKNNNLVKIVGTKKEAESLTKSSKSNTGVLRTKIIENAYKKYMKEHPNSKMKLSEFKTSYKKK